MSQPRSSQPPALRLVHNQADPKPPEHCDGGFTCMCTLCQAERAALVARGPRGNPSDPFHRAA